jgi:cyclophilin family peptidyl-prolyl cis-trans isomerase
LTDGATYVAVFDTSMGEMRFTLDTDSTPLTTNNFVALARYGYYDGTEFFRTDTSIDIIQGGAPHTNSPSDQGPGYNLTDEPQFAFDGFALQGTYTYEPGQLVMARTGTPNGASAQFFFAAGPNTSRLDATGDFDGSGTYVVFGQTDAAGQQVMADILALHVDDPSSGLGGAPSETVVVNSVTIEES